MKFGNITFRRIAPFVALPATLLAIAGIFTFVQAVNTNSIDLEESAHQFLSHPDDPSFDITGDMTIEAWVKLESYTQQNNQIVDKVNDSETDVAYALRWRQDTDPGNTIDLFLSSTGKCCVTKQVVYTLPLNTWTHIAAVYESTRGLVTFYVNGAQQGSTLDGAPHIINNSAAPFSIGAARAGNFSYFDGLIDEVRVWNIARTSADIVANYNRELNGSEFGLLHYYKLDGDFRDLSDANDSILAPQNGLVFSSDIVSLDSPLPIPPLPPPPGGGSSTIKAFKSADESVTGSSTLQEDDHLFMNLESNKSYVIDGNLFVSASKPTDDFKIAFEAPDGAALDLGYEAVSDHFDHGAGVLHNSLEESGRLLVRKPITQVKISGTIKTGANSVALKLLWAQFTSRPSSITIEEGSYLRADNI